MSLIFFCEASFALSKDLKMIDWLNVIFDGCLSVWLIEDEYIKCFDVYTYVYKYLYLSKCVFKLLYFK